MVIEKKILTILKMVEVVVEEAPVEATEVEAMVVVTITNNSHWE